MQEDLKTNLQSRLRLQPENDQNNGSSNGEGATDNPPPEPTPVEDDPQDTWPEEMEGRQDKTQPANAPFTLV